MPQTKRQRRRLPWLPQNVVAEVDRIARFFQVKRDDTKLWNQHREPDELRMLTGFGWEARNGSQSRQGFKSLTMAYVDCHYTLVRRAAAPTLKPRLRLVVNNKRKRAG